jgi:hypothetical protein
MATMNMRITLGQSQIERLAKWRSLMGYPPEKSHDMFIRDMILRGLDENVPDVKEE